MCSRQRDAKVAHAVGAWEQPGENACVRSIRNGAGGEGLCEANPLLCELIDRWSLDPFVSVASNVVAPQRVDGDEKDVAMGWVLCRAIIADEGRRSH